MQQRAGGSTYCFGSDPTVPNMLGYRAHDTTLELGNFFYSDMSNVKVQPSKSLEYDYND